MSSELIKNKNALRLLLSANIISGFAQGISMLAIPWYFTSIIDRASLFGAIYAISTFASLFWNLYAGTLIDRYPRKSIFMYVSLVCGTILLGVAAYGFIVGSVPIALVGLVFVTTMFNYNIHFGALYAFGQELTMPSQYGKISSYLEIQNQATSIFSGAFAAILLTGAEAGKKLNIIGLEIEIPFHIPRWEMHDIFLFDGITYFIAILLVWLIRYTPPSDRVIDTSTIAERVKAGINFLKKNPAIFSFGNYSYSIFVVLMVQVFMLLPIYVKNHLESGSDVYASAEVLYSMGALFAGIFIRKLFKNRDTVYSIIILLILTTSIFYIVAFTKSILIFYLFSFLVGITNAGARVLRTTYLFSHVSNDIIGRTNSVFNVINILLRSLLLIVFSMAWFSEASHITWAYFMCGSFTLVSAYLLFRNYKKL